MPTLAVSLCVTCSNQTMFSWMLFILSHSLSKQLVYVRVGARVDLFWAQMPVQQLWDAFRMLSINSSSKLTSFLSWFYRLFPRLFLCLSPAPSPSLFRFCCWRSLGLAWFGVDETKPTHNFAMRFFNFTFEQKFRPKPEPIQQWIATEYTL